jgi:hypothetical protein
MSDTEPQTAGGKVLWHFTMSPDGFVAGPNHEIDLHIAPILLGQGIRLYDNPGGAPIRLHRLGQGDPTSVVNVRYRPTTTGKI